LGPDDILLYYPVPATKSGAFCSISDPRGCNGRNHWHIPVRLPNQTSVSVEAAFGFTGGAANCETALGFHEVYEATTEASSADACNALTDSGWYSENGCGQAWKLQYVSPADHEWSTHYCAKLAFN